MTRARRGNAVLAHSYANLKGHFARNGYKRALRALRGKGSFRAGKRHQEPPAAVVWGRKPGERASTITIERSMFDKFKGAADKISSPFISVCNLCTLLGMNVPYGLFFNAMDATKHIISIATICGILGLRIPFNRCCTPVDI